MIKTESRFDPNCGKCKRRIGDLELACARPVGADNKMVTACLKCTREWDRQNLDEYLKRYIHDTIIPQMDKEKKERDERYEKRMKEEENNATN